MRESGHCFRFAFNTTQLTEPALPVASSVRTTVTFIFFIFMALALYLPYIPIDYYADDFVLVFANPSAPPWHFFSQPTKAVYRPIEAVLLALIQQHFSMNTYPLNLLQLTLHLSLCMVIYVAMVGLGLSHLQATLGSCFMLVSQANVHAVLSNDTLSQVSSTLFGSASIWLAYRADSAHDDRQSGPTKMAAYHYLSVAALAISLFSKESGTAFVVIIVAFYLWLRWKETHTTARLAYKLLPYAVVLAIYLLVRSMVVSNPPTLGTGNYEFRIGFNILRNLGMLIMACGLPTSSVRVFSSIGRGDVFMLLIVAGFSMAFGIAVLYGLWRSSNRLLLIVMSGLVVIGCFPMAMMNHVSELHAYNSMPFVAVLVGAAMGRVIELNKRRWLSVVAISGLMAVVFVSHASAVQSKASMMKRNGARATKLINELQRCASRMPLNGGLVLVNPKAIEAPYSVFIMNGFDVLEMDGVSRLKELSNRPDLRIEILDSSSVVGARRRGEGLAFLHDHATDGAPMVTCVIPTANKGEGSSGNATPKRVMDIPDEHMTQGGSKEGQ
jgi:hypothetical protein